MEPLDYLLIVLIVVAVWAVVELALTIRKARATLDDVSHSATEAIDQTTPLIAKLDGVADELQPALREVPGLMEKVTVTVDEANIALGAMGGILGDVNSATRGVASVGESASRIVNTATSAAVGVVSKVASIGGINIPEGQQLIGKGEPSGEGEARHMAATDEYAEEQDAPRGGYVTYVPVSAPDASEE